MAFGNRLTSTGKSVGVVFFYDWRIKSCLHCTNMAYTVGSIYLSIAVLLFYKRLFRIMLTMQGICSRRTSARRNSCEGNATSPIGRRAAAILLPFEISIPTPYFIFISFLFFFIMIGSNSSTYLHFGSLHENYFNLNLLKRIYYVKVG